MANTPDNKLSRREFLERGLLVGAGLVAGACCTSIVIEEAFRRRIVSVGDSEYPTVQPTTPNWEATGQAYDRQTPQVQPTADARAATAPATRVAVCKPAEQLGPWAPDAFTGNGHNIELTADQQHILHANLWWPKTNNFDGKEISIEITPGHSYEAANAAGTAWQYDVGCGVEKVRQDIIAHVARRQAAGEKIFGMATEQQLVNLGLLKVRPVNYGK